MRLTDRDLEILRLICRFGLATSAQVQARFFTSQSRAYERVADLVGAGYLHRAAVFASQPAVLSLTAAGADASGAGLSAPRVVISRINHDLAVLDLSAELLAGNRGAEWVTEREIRRDRMSRDLAGRLQKVTDFVRVPDGVLVLAAGERLAVELDLTPKSPDDYRRILRYYSRPPREYARVLYYVSPPCARARLQDLIESRNLKNFVEVHEYGPKSRTAPAS